MITLFGTVTSPFVRRVRVVCLEKAVPVTLVDTFTDDGQAQLKHISPIAKVPVARFPDNRIVYDSRVILDELCHAQRGLGALGWPPLRPPAEDADGAVEEENAVNLADEALLSLIRLFYLKRDGADLSVAYLKKEQARAATILSHLNDTMHGNFLTAKGEREISFGRPELALYTALDWMRFRKVHDLSTTPALQKMVDHWSIRPSLQQTAPPAAG